MRFSFPSSHPRLTSDMGSVIFAGALYFLFLTLFASPAAAQGGGASQRQLWCVAKNNAEDAALQSALDWACGPGGANCGPIQNGGPCYDASDLVRTVSFAFNDYFLKHSPSEENCDFANTAALTSLDPSHNHCKFPSSSSLRYGNGNFSGTATADSGSANFSTSCSIPRNGERGSFSILLFAAIALVIE